MGIAKVEDIIGQTVRRDIGRMKRFAEGQLEAAARSIMSTPNAHVGIVTGFFIRNAVPPSPETDGLGGMAHMAAALANLGIPVTVISDAPCSKAVWAVTTELPKGVALEITSLSAASVKSLRFGMRRFQRCPVGRHWTMVTPVRASELSDDERRAAEANRDIALP